jgi:hypothetical protein
LCESARFADGLALAQRAVLWRRDQDVPTSPWIAEAETAAAQCNLGLGRTDDARAYAGSAVERLGQLANVSAQIVGPARRVWNDTRAR